jgi:hypothetical protein
MLLLSRSVYSLKLDTSSAIGRDLKYVVHFSEGERAYSKRMEKTELIFQRQHTLPLLDRPFELLSPGFLASFVRTPLYGILVRPP